MHNLNCCTKQLLPTVIYMLICVKIATISNVRIFLFMIHFLKVTFHLLTNECRCHFPFGPTLIRVLVIKYTAKTSSGIVSNHVTVHFEIGFLQNCPLCGRDESSIMHTFLTACIKVG